MVSPFFARISGHGQTLLIPITGLVKPSGEALTQVASHVYSTTSARHTCAREASNILARDEKIIVEIAGPKPPVSEMQNQSYNRTVYSSSLNEIQARGRSTKLNNGDFGDTRDVSWPVCTWPAPSKGFHTDLISEEDI